VAGITILRLLSGATQATILSSADEILALKQEAVLHFKSILVSIHFPLSFNKMSQRNQPSSLLPNPLSFRRWLLILIVVFVHLRVNFWPAMTGAAAVDLEFAFPHIAHAV